MVVVLDIRNVVLVLFFLPTANISRILALLSERHAVQKSLFRLHVGSFFIQ